MPGLWYNMWGGGAERARGHWTRANRRQDGFGVSIAVPCKRTISAGRCINFRQERQPQLLGHALQIGRCIGPQIRLTPDAGNDGDHQPGACLVAQHVLLDG